MMNTKKVTKRDNFAAIEAILREMGNNTLADVMVHEIKLLNSKSEKKTVSKNAKQNAILDERIMAVLEDGVDRSATAIMNMVDASDIEGLETLTLPRITNRLTALGREAKKVDRIVDKKKVTFRKGTGEGFPELTKKEKSVEE